MKNKSIINVILLLIIVVIIVVFSRSKLNSIDDNIYDINWYHYNHNSGYYDVIKFTKDSVSYTRPMNINEVSSYDSCKKYYYDRKNNILSLDCKKQIKFVEVKDNKLTLEIEDRTITFFKNINDSLNYEFESYYGKSIVEFKKEKEQAKDFIKINSKRLNEVINSSEFSKVIFIGDKCTSVDCALGLDVMEKWISTTENVYYFDVKDLNKDLLNRFNKINSELETDINYYNNIQPLVLIFKENKLVDGYYINCNGFNCNKYYKNEFN